MKLIRYAIVMVVIAASNTTLVAAQEGRHVKTTGDLVELCSVSAEDPLHDAAMGFCLGYIDAALDYHAALTASPSFDPIACPRPTVTREEVVVVFVDWSKRNTQHMQGNAPVHGVMRAVFEKWPCSK